MAQREKTVVNDLTVGSPAKSMIRFAIPMILGNVVQQLYNMADSLVVGNYEGTAALSAVGIAGSVTFLYVALATGLSIGASVIISQYFGAREMGKMKAAISTSLIFAFVISAILTVVGVVLSPYVLEAMDTPGTAFTDANDYLKIYFYGTIFVFLYNAINSVFNALGESKLPLYFLIFSSLLNVGLDIWFVGPLGMGVAGAAIATTISQGVAMALSGVVLFFRLKKLNIQEEARRFDWKILKITLRVGIPAVIQQSVVSVGFLLIQAAVNGFGAIAAAGYTAAGKIDNLAAIPFISMANAASTYTAQNIGANKPERVPKGVLAATITVVVIALVLTGALYLFGDTMVGWFVDMGEENALEVIDVGMGYIHTVSLFYVVMAIQSLYTGVLRGAGDVPFQLASIMANFVVRVAAAFFLASLGEVHLIWWSAPIGWFLGALVAGIRYLQGGWKKKSAIRE